MRFDLSPYLLRGSVSKAELCLSMNHYGIADADRFAVHRLVREREAIRPVDTLSDDAEEIGGFEIKAGDACPSRHKVDVTDAVNALLASGHVQLVLRVCDKTAEKRGNPELRPRGADIARKSLCLEIAP